VKREQPHRNEIREQISLDAMRREYVTKGNCLREGARCVREGGKLERERSKPVREGAKPGFAAGAAAVDAAPVDWRTALTSSTTSAASFRRGDFSFI